MNNLLGLGAVATILTRNPEAFAQKCPPSGIGPSCDAPRWRCTQLCVPPGEYQYLIHAVTEARAKQAHEAPLETLRLLSLAQSALSSLRSRIPTSSGAVSGNRDRVTIQWSFTRKQARKKFGYRIAR